MLLHVWLPARPRLALPKPFPAQSVLNPLNALLPNSTYLVARAVEDGENAKQPRNLHQLPLRLLPHEQKMLPHSENQVVMSPLPDVAMLQAVMNLLQTVLEIDSLVASSANLLPLMPDPVLEPQPQLTLRGLLKS